MNKSFVATAVILCSTFLASPAYAISIALDYEIPVVADAVTQLDASTRKYDFTVTNKAMTLYSEFSDTVRLTDYLLPYFSDAAISVSQIPTGWAWRIDTDDRFNLGHGAQTLHWYSTSLSSGIAGGINGFGNVPDLMENTLGGFSYTSGFGPVKAPFMAGFSASPWLWLQGDPALPGSPDAQAAGLNQPFSVTSVPEPATVALMAAGLMLIGVTGRAGRKSGKRASLIAG